MILLHLIFVTGHPVRNVLLIAAGGVAAWLGVRLRDHRAMHQAGTTWAGALSSLGLAAALLIAWKMHTRHRPTAAAPVGHQAAQNAVTHVVSAPAAASGLTGGQITTIAIVALIVAGIVACVWRWLYRRS